MQRENIKNKFVELFKSTPLLVRAPGRVNLIGEHTDYNDGFVLPAAIDKEMIFAIAKNDLNKFRFYAYDLNKSFELDVKDFQKTDTQWANYLLGVLSQFRKLNLTTCGVDCVFGGDIPLGAGLSSSAALEVGFAVGINELFKFGIDKMQLVKMAQKAEHEYAGVNCGIMDQFASMFGKKNHVIKLDCRSLEYKLYPLDLTDYKVVLCDTQVKHNLASGEYNKRRKECETGVAIIKKYKPDINSLRDVPIELLEAHKNEMDSTVYKRGHYVIGENIRLETGCEALLKGDIKTFGEKMHGSHTGLRDEYEVSCKELDFLEALAKKSDEVTGARMMGGGFGGCTINLVKKDSVDIFAKKATEAFKKEFNHEPRIFIASLVDGAEVIQ